MKRIMRITSAFLISICLLTGSGAVLAAASEDPVVDVGVVETSTKNNGVLIKENKTSGSEYVYTVSTGDGRQYSGSSDEPFGEITVNADRIDVDASSSLPANGVMVNNETTADVVINVQGEISVDEDYKASTSASAYGMNIDASGNGSTTASVGDIDVSTEGDENASAEGVYAETEKGSTVSLEVGDVTASSFAASQAPKTDMPKSVATGINMANVGTMTAEAGDITVSASANQSYSRAIGAQILDAGTASLKTGNIDAKAGNEATGVQVQASNVSGAKTTTVRVGDITAQAGSAKGMNVAADPGGTADIIAGNIIATSGTAGGVLANAMGISTTGKNEGVGGTLNVQTGDITVSSTQTATGINAVSLRGTDPSSGKHCSGSVSIESGQISVTVDNEGYSGSKSQAYGINSSAYGSSVSVKTEDITVDADCGAAGVYAITGSSTDKGSQTRVPGMISLETGNITAKGQNSVGVVLQGEQIKAGVEPSSQISVVSDGTVSGDDVSVKVYGSAIYSNNGTTTYYYDTDHIDVTVWAAKENEDGEIVRAVTVDNTGKTPTEIIDRDLSAALEKKLNYIVKVADAWSGRMSVCSTEKNHTVTIGDRDYFTANEGENVTFRISLDQSREDLEGVYYNNDDASTLTVAGSLIRDEQGNYIFSMKRGGAMLLGLKLHTHTPGAVVTENYVAATCHSHGSYDSVVYCSECGKELSRSTVITPQLQHIPGEPAIENMTAYGYDLVTRCILCGTILNSEHISTGPAEEFVAVDDDTYVNGVRAADRQPIDEVFALIGEALDSEHAEVLISHTDKILDASEMARYENLNASDRLMVVLAALNASGVIRSPLGKMSDEAQALADEIAERITSMSDEERASLDALIRELFDVKKEVIDGKERDTICIELTVIMDGREEKEHYRFFDDDGIWKLYRIEIAQPVPR